MLRRSSLRTPGAGALAVLVFCLTAIPRAGVRIGPIPLYFVDVVMVVVLLYALRAAPFPRGGRPFATTVALLFIFAVLGELGGAAVTGAVPDLVYLVGRTALAFAAFFAAGQLVRGPKDLELVLKAAVLGLIVTAATMILTSLPATRTAVTDLVFSIRLLEPAGENVIDTYAESGSKGGESGVRGRTLVGVSIMGATFVNAVWPLGALLLRWPGPLGQWRMISLAACLLAPMGVLMSYSRGPILGSILMVLLVLLLGFRRVRRGILLPVVVGAGIVFLVGVGSQIFFFDRLTNRTTAILDDPLADERESERLLAYSEPFRHVTEHPRFLVVGEGNAITRSTSYAEQSGSANHALFAQAYYSHGMVAAFLYMILIVRALHLAAKYFLYSRSTLGAHYSQAVLLSIVALVPWAAFGHAIVSEPRGAMLFFFVLGLLTSLRHFPMRPMPARFQRVGNGYGRRAAVG